MSFRLRLFLILATKTDVMEILEVTDVAAQGFIHNVRFDSYNTDFCYSSHYTRSFMVHSTSAYNQAYTWVL